MISKSIRIGGTAAIVLLIASVAFGQRYGEEYKFNIHAGYLNPKDPETGMLAGAVCYKPVDESVSLGIGFDVWHKVYRDEKEVAEQTRPDRNTKTYATELEISDWAVPLTLEVYARVPLARHMGYSVRGNIGYTFLWSKYNNYEEDTSTNRDFGGICWQLGAGIYSDIGSRSTLAADIFYNNSEVSCKVDNSEAGLPIFERVNLSGFGIRVGVLLDLR
jgi:hypothetical protein